MTSPTEAPRTPTTHSGKTTVNWVAAVAGEQYRAAAVMHVTAIESEVAGSHENPVARGIREIRLALRAEAAAPPAAPAGLPSGERLYRVFWAVRWEGGAYPNQWEQLTPRQQETWDQIAAAYAEGEPE